MKRIAFTIALVFGLGLVGSRAEVRTQGSTENSTVRTIKSPRFAHPLLEKWIEEYAKTEPGVVFQIVKGSTNQDDIHLNVTLDNQDPAAENIVYFGETAVLPITARSSHAAHLLAGKQLNSKKLKQLFFLNDELEEDVRKNKVFEAITVYSGSNASSVTSAFAHNLGEDSGSFRGRRIAGDDLFLNTAIAKDSLGVTFNTLSNIFDLQSRHVKSNLSLIGLDLKKTISEGFSNEGTLDDILTTLEKSRIAEVAIERVGIEFDSSDDTVKRFLQWVVNIGIRYNHQYGFLNLDSKDFIAQTAKLRHDLTAQK